MTLTTDTSRPWRVAIHLSVMLGVFVPLLGFVAPLAIWVLKQDDHPELRAHAYVVINWVISATIYCAVLVLLTMTLILMPLTIPALALLGLATIAFTIFGAMKAADGIVWEYPLSIRFFS